MLGEEGREVTGSPTTQSLIGHWKDFSFHIEKNGELCMVRAEKRLNV